MSSDEDAVTSEVARAAMHERRSIVPGTWVTYRRLRGKGLIEGIVVALFESTFTGEVHFTDPCSPEERRELTCAVLWTFVPDVDDDDFAANGSYVGFINVQTIFRNSSFEVNA